MCGVVKRTATDSCNILFQRVTNLIVLLNRMATFCDSHTNLGWTPWIITIIIVFVDCCLCWKWCQRLMIFCSIASSQFFFCCHSGSDFNVINTLFFASRYCPHIFAMFSLSHLLNIQMNPHATEIIRFRPWLFTYRYSMQFCRIFVSYSSNNQRQRKRENEGMNIGSRFCVTVSL